MTIEHHEDATVYRSGVVQHPLGGRPQFVGVNDSANGPYARIQDGDLVLRVDDVATLTRWAEQFGIAAQQLAAHLARIAKSEQARSETGAWTS